MKKLFWLLTTVLFCSCATFHKGYVGTSGGGRIYYEERGKGEVLLLLHGHSLDRRMWDEQFKSFAKQYRTLRLDFRGYGLSSEQREDLQMTHADDVIALMDSLDIRKAHVVGLSMGAFVAGDLLAMYPERLITCTMASAGIRSVDGPSVPVSTEEREKKLRSISEVYRQGIENYKRQWTEQLIASGGSQRERMRKPLTRMIQDWTAWQATHVEVHLYYGKEAWQRLEQQQNDTPTLFIRGENEAKGKKGEPRELRYLKNGRYVVIPDCGHMLNMERPEEFNRAVLDFINSYPMR